MYIYVLCVLRLAFGDWCLLRLHSLIPNYCPHQTCILYFFSYLPCNNYYSILFKHFLFFILFTANPIRGINMDRLHNSIIRIQTMLDLSIYHLDFFMPKKRYPVSKDWLLLNGPRVYKRCLRCGMMTAAIVIISNGIWLHPSTKLWKVLSLKQRMNGIQSPEWDTFWMHCIITKLNLS